MFKYKKALIPILLIGDSNEIANIELTERQYIRYANIFKMIFQGEDILLHRTSNLRKWVAVKMIKIIFKILRIKL